MKKILLIIIGFTTVINLQAQTSERQLGGGSSTCDGYWDDIKLDCTAPKGVCCLGEVIITPKSFTILGTLLENGDNDKIAELAKTGFLKKEFGKNSLSAKAYDELIAGLINRSLVLEKITFPPNGKISKISSIEILIKRVSKSNKLDIIGHVTLLCRNCGDPLIKK